MSGRGPAPKDPAKRRRRNADPVPTSKLTNDKRTRGPALPDGILADGEDWHQVTRSWWNNWRKSPMAATFLQTDWDFLLDTALMHHTMWAKKRWEFAGEVRLRAAKFGATPEDRARLRFEVETEATAKRTAEAEAHVTDLAARRARLTG